MSLIVESLRNIREEIHRTCSACGRDPKNVELIAVSKTHPVEAIQEAYKAGQRHFGESRLQELEEKMVQLPNDIVWHFIGKLQSNKIKKFVATGAILHSLESLHQLQMLEKTGVKCSAFIQVKLAEEETKSGISLEALDELCHNVLTSPTVRLLGYMLIGPGNLSAEETRPYFRQLKELAENKGEQMRLSFGMSGDWEVAIQEGSNYLRIGTAIFGVRSK